MFLGQQIYKEDFVRFLSAYYGGKVKETSLSSYIQVEGVPEPERAQALERQFKDFVATLG